MKVQVTIGDDEAIIEIINETTQDRDKMGLAVGTNEECKVKRNGSTKFILPITKTPIGKVADPSQKTAHGDS